MRNNDCDCVFSLEPTVFIPQSEYSIEEDVGELFIPIKRSGDVSQELIVICYTQQGTWKYPPPKIRISIFNMLAT